MTGAASSSAAAASELDALEAQIAAATRADELAAFMAHTGAPRPSGDALGQLAAAPATSARLARLGEAAGPDGSRARLLARRLARARVRRRVPIQARSRVDAAAVTAAARWRTDAHDADAGVREQAWRARHAAHAADVPILLDWARRAASSSAWTEALASEALTVAGVDDAWRALELATRAPWAAARAALAAEAPWDLDRWDRALVAAVEARLAALSGRDALAASRAILGGPVPSGVRIAGGQGGAVTYLVDPPRDVRVLVPSVAASLPSWATLAHELGHAVLATAHDPTAPFWLRDAAAPWLHELGGQVLAGVVSHPAWLTDVLGLSPAQAVAVAARRELERLLVLRLRLVHVRLEQAILDGAEPAATYAALMADLVGVAAGSGATPAWVHAVRALAERPGGAASALLADAVVQRLPRLAPDQAVAAAAALGRAGAGVAPETGLAMITPA